MAAQGILTFLPFFRRTQSGHQGRRKRRCPCERGPRPLTSSGHGLNPEVILVLLSPLHLSRLEVTSHPHSRVRASEVNDQRPEFLYSRLSDTVRKEGYPETILLAFGTQGSPRGTSPLHPGPSQLRGPAPRHTLTPGVGCPDARPVPTGSAWASDRPL